MDNNNILNYLVEHKGTLDQVNFAKKIINTPDEVLGVKTNIIKKLAKKISQQNFLYYLNNAQTNNYEQKLLYGFVLGYANLSLQQFKLYLNKFYNFLNCWALVDSPLCVMQIIKNNKSELFDFFVFNINNKNPFVVRFSIVCFFKYYLCDELINKIIDIYKNINREEYYIKIALAWAICEILIKNYNKGIDLLKQKVLNPWVQNKAIQKACESYRINSKQKEFLKTLKM